MKRLTIVDVMELAGLGAVSYGAGLEFGLGFGMMTFGIVLLGYSIVSRRAGVKK